MLVYQRVNPAALIILDKLQQPHYGRKKVPQGDQSIQRYFEQGIQRGASFFAFRQISEATKTSKTHSWTHGLDLFKVTFPFSTTVNDHDENVALFPTTWSKSKMEITREPREQKMWGFWRRRLGPLKGKSKTRHSNKNWMGPYQRAPK